MNENICTGGQKWNKKESERTKNKKGKKIKRQKTRREKNGERITKK